MKSLALVEVFLEIQVFLLIQEIKIENNTSVEGDQQKMPDNSISCTACNIQ